jgi:hypothetical protein
MQKCFYANDFYLGDTEVQTDTFPLFNYIYLLPPLYLLLLYYTFRLRWMEGKRDPQRVPSARRTGSLSPFSQFIFIVLFYFYQDTEKPRGKSSRKSIQSLWMSFACFCTENTADFNASTYILSPSVFGFKQTLTFYLAVIS